MSPLHTPRTRDQYLNEDERILYDYFVKTLCFGDDLHSRLSFEFLIEVRNFAKGKTVLDAGAGHKRFEPFFKNSNYLSLEHHSGIDMKNMEGISYDFVCELDGDDFAVDGGSVDAIYNHSVLEHIAKPEKFFQNAFNALKEGGRLFIHCPFTYVEHEAPFDYNRFTRYGLRKRLEDAGFCIVKLMPSSNAAYGATSFVLNAIEHECTARGITLEGVTFPDGDVVPLVPLLTLMLNYVNKMTDDAIYDSAFPIGWICVAEKNVK